MVRLLWLSMLYEGISIEELNKKRPAVEFVSWFKQKIDQIYYSSSEGRKALRLHKGLMKPFMEEIYPLAIWVERKFGDTDQVLIQPVIGNQDYDAEVTDLRTKPPSQSYLEITQAHEGENNYWRRVELSEKGSVFPYAPVIKKGKGKNRTVSIPPEATSVEERVRNELERILAAAKRKAGKNCPANTSLLIFFDDAPPFQEVIGNKQLDSFINENILSLDLRFSTLYVFGRDVFREFSLV